MEKEIPFTGILSNKPEENPGFHSIHLFIRNRHILLLFFRSTYVIVFLAFADFFNWNRVKLRYCDGASFAGDGQHQVEFDIFVFLK